MPRESPGSESQKGGSAPKSDGEGEASARSVREIPAFNAKTLQALLKVHSDDLEKGKGGVRESISKVLSLEEKDLTRAITSMVRVLREEVLFLLEGVTKNGSKKLKHLSIDKVDVMRGKLGDEHAVISLDELSSWKKDLVRECSSNGKDAEKVLERQFKERNASRPFQENARILENVEVVFLVDEVARNRERSVREALESTVQSTGPKNTLKEIRARLYELLSPEKKKQFNVMEKFDLLRQEIHAERENREYQRISTKILSAFGRRQGQALFHPIGSLVEAVKEGEATVRFVLGRMTQEKKIVFMKNEEGVDLYLCRDPKVLKYTSGELSSTLALAYFDQVGAFLRQALDRGEIVDRGYLEDHVQELQLPADVALWLLDCYVDLGLLKRTREGYKMPRGCEKAVLSSTAFRRINLSEQFYDLAVALNEEEKEEVGELSWGTIHEEYRKFREKRSLKVIPLATKKPSAKVLPITEIQFGHKDLDEKALEQFLDRLRTLPDSEKPDKITVSGLLFGRFKNWEKDKHRLKVYEMGRQLSRAKWFLDQVRQLGVPVVYNMSDNDALIVKEYTYDAVALIEDVLRGATYNPQREQHLARGAAYWQFEIAQRSKAWPQHFAFEWDTVFEYMLRSGRELYTAAEVQDRTGEYIEEYLLLLYAYKKLKDGESLQELADGGDTVARTALAVLEVQNIPIPGKPAPDNLTVTSDFDMDVKTAGREWKWEERHFFRQTPTSKVQDPLKEAREDIGQRHAMGEESPRVLAVEGESHAVGSLEGGKTLVFSTPGLHRVRDGDSSYTNVLSDEGRRKQFARGERFTPGLTPVTLHDDGRISIDFWNERLLDIAAKTRERMAYVFFSDWQTGSVTSRPDLYAKAMDYAFHVVAKQYKTRVDFGGDINQCRNYIQMPNENCDVGLVRIDDQALFTDSSVRETFEGVPSENKANIIGAGVCPGNHEWNSGYAFYGANHSLFLRSALYDWLKGHADIDYGIDSAVRFRDEYFKSSTIISDVAGYKVLAQHIFMDRMNKGGGGIPIYQFQQLLRGVGEKMEGVDIMETGHFHHPMWHMVNDKIGVINGSIAGISGYEWWRGYNPVIATTVFYLGGGLPPKLDIVTKEALYNYEPQGFYSKENLEKKGFSTDKDFDPTEHGFGRLRVRDGTQLKQLPQSGIQKYLWNKVDDILRRVPATLPKRRR